MLKSVGFYKELRHPEESDVSIKGIISDQALKNESKIVSYLEQGDEITFLMGPCFDVLKDKEEVINHSSSIRSDGVWRWPSELSYYVKNYHIKLPTEFLNYLDSIDYQIGK
jgi:hypothetical protein